MTPFSLPRPAGGSRARRLVLDLAAQAAEWLLGLRRLGAIYARRGDGEFVETALRALDIIVDVDRGQLARIPVSGPVILVANHPSGALDGLALAAALLRVRADVRFLGNHLLTRIPDLRTRTIPVDPFAPRSVLNRRGLRSARRWLASGGALIVFPAGEVSSLEGARGGRVDGGWKRGVLRLAAWSGASVVPVFIGGQPTRWLRWAARVDDRLRTAVLPRELLARRGSRVPLMVGTPVSPERLQRLPDDDARLAYLRARTYGLRPASPSDGRLMWRARQRPVLPVASPESADLLAADVQALPDDARLLTSGEYEVYCAAAGVLPAVLREIGRLRESTFRQAGEGTGQARDLDRFDRDYLHLFVWHAGRREVVGAYRLGLTDRLRARHGPRGLYTRTLFRFGAPLLDEIGPAIELGRSFVRTEYQRDSNGLLLLWKGIGRFVARHPRYRRLFGPVSISAEYQSFTRHLLARFLSHQAFASDLARLVQPRRALTPEPDTSLLVRARVVAHLEDVEALVREVEAGRGLPVLLRQYLKLNARLLGFSVDPGFGNVLDGLMLVDLLEVRPALLQRYFGRDGVARLHAYHAPASPPDLVPAPAPR